MAEDITQKSVSAGKKIAADSSTQKYLPFTEIRDNLIIMKDGSSRMVLRIKPLNFSLKSEQEQDSIIYGYQRFLNSLRFPVQIIVRSRKVDIEGYLMKLENVAVKQTNVLLQEQTYRYVDFLKNLVDVAQIMKKDFFIIVPFDKENEESVRKTGVMGMFKNFWFSVNQSDDLGSIREKRRRSDILRKGNTERINMIKASLESVGLRSEEVKKDELVKLLISYYNPKLGGDFKVNDINAIKMG